MKTPGARVIKAFNTVFAGHTDTGRVKNEPITLFVTGDEGDSMKEGFQGLTS